jgi:hypothetical protein
MKTVEVTFILEIDTDDENYVERVVNEMDYDFSYVQMVDVDGTNLEERNFIVDSYMKDFDIF